MGLANHGSHFSRLGFARRSFPHSARERTAPATGGLLLRLLACFLLIVVIANVAHAAEGNPEITGVRVGIADRYKVGFWTPLEFTLKGGNEALQGQLEFTVPDGDGIPTRIVSPPNKPVALLPGQETTVPLFAKIGQMDPEISVRLLVEGRERASRKFDSNNFSVPTALDTNRTLVVTVGRPLALVSAAEDADQPSTIYVQIEKPSQFPLRWYGYDGVDSVVLCTSDPSIFRQLSASSAQLKALDQWVRLGGRLLLCVGSKADEVLAADAPLSVFAPGKFSGVVDLKRINAWESYVESAEPLDVKSLVNAEGEFRISVPRLESVRGKIEAYEGSSASDLPLVIRAAHGLGEVVFVAADLDRPPFTKWAAKVQLLDKLLGRPRQQAEEDPDAAAAAASASAYGYGDLTGQLRSALEQFQGVELVPFSLVATLIILYILAIGPLDYLLLKRGLKRMELTWLTFPAMVLLFSGAAYFLAYWLKGDQLRVNQVDIVDYDTEADFVRGTTWSNIFSPRVDSYNLTYSPKIQGGTSLNDQQMLVSWMGLPGSGFGGMGSPTGATALFTGSYDFTPSLDALEGMPIAVWSTKGVIGRWSGNARSPVVAELTDKGDQLLAGSIQSKLDDPLTDCVLIYDRWAYPIGTLDARARFSVEGKLDPQTVETYFKQASLFDGKSTLSTYDPASLQVERIVEAMMFHRHLGGNGYTRISNQYQQFIDLSGQLNCGRAILVGRSAAAATTLTRDGKSLESSGDRRWTFYRFVLPVGAKK